MNTSHEEGHIGLFNALCANYTKTNESYTRRRQHIRHPQYLPAMHATNFTLLFNIHFIGLGALERFRTTFSTHRFFGRFSTSKCPVPLNSFLTGPEDKRPVVIRKTAMAAVGEARHKADDDMRAWRERWNFCHELYQLTHELQLWELYDQKDQQCHIFDA